MKYRNTVTCKLIICLHLILLYNIFVSFYEFMINFYISLFFCNLYEIWEMHNISLCVYSRWWSFMRGYGEWKI